MLQPQHSNQKNLSMTSHLPKIQNVAICLCFTTASLLISPAMALAQSTPVSAIKTVDPRTVESTDNLTLTTTAIPPRLEVSAKPGSTIQKTIKVQNTSSTTLNYSSDIENFIVAEDGITPVPIKESVTSRYSLASWVTISPTKFTLKPNETQVMDVLIQVPIDALPGGHYAMILHQPGAASHRAGEALTAVGSSGVAARVGSLVYMTVEGPVTEQAFIRSFTAPSLVEFGPVAFKYKVENRSDVHIRPQSSIEIKDIFGRSIDKIKVDERNIFPLTTREFSAEYTRYWGLGRYTAQLVVPYGSHGSVTQSSISFWIIPYRLIAGVALLLAAMGAIVILIRRYMLHKSDEKTKQIEVLQQRVSELEHEEKE